MEFYIRTIENGKRLSLDAVEAKRLDVKERILETGAQYVEIEAMMGSSNATGERIEERVYIIRAVSGVQYV